MTRLSKLMSQLKFKRNQTNQKNWFQIL